MFLKLHNQLSSLGSRLAGSIGLLPTSITLACAMAAVVLISTDLGGPTQVFHEHVPLVVIRDGDTARAVLVTLAGGLVSLTVFSFTMVMAQLNRAAASYSPRLLPGLISARSHQVVLGLFLGTIVFCLLVLISIEPEKGAYALPGIAILTAVALGMLCLGLFVYFIHRISIAIQITDILERVASRTACRIEVVAETKEERQVGESKLPELEDSFSLKEPDGGYFHGSNIGSLLELASEHDLVIRVLPVRGDFVHAREAVVCVDRKIDDELGKLILSSLRFSRDDRVEENYLLGFRHITEIAVRAMSPGVNDPGTAINAIDHLTSLLGLRMGLDDHEEYTDQDGDVRLSVGTVSFEELLYDVCAPLRNYCSHDPIIVVKLFDMLGYLHGCEAVVDGYHRSVEVEGRQLFEDAMAKIDSARDQEHVKRKWEASRLGSSDEEPSGDE